MPAPSVNELNRMRAAHFFEWRDEAMKDARPKAEVEAIELTARFLAGEPLSPEEYWEYNKRVIFNGHVFFYPAED